MSLLRIHIPSSWPDAEPDGAVDLVGAELFVHQRGTVKAGTRSNIVINIKHRAHFCSLNAFNIKSQNTDVVGQIVLTI